MILGTIFWRFGMVLIVHLHFYLDSVGIQTRKQFGQLAISYLFTFRPMPVQQNRDLWPESSQNVTNVKSKMADVHKNVLMSLVVLGVTVKQDLSLGLIKGKVEIKYTYKSVSFRPPDHTFFRKQYFFKLDTVDFDSLLQF